MVQTVLSQLNFLHLLITICSSLNPLFLL